jgi:hypothetical protein
VLCLTNYAPCFHSLVMWFIGGCFGTTQGKKMALVNTCMPDAQVMQVQIILLDMVYVSCLFRYAESAVTRRRKEVHHTTQEANHTWWTGIWLMLRVLLVCVVFVLVATVSMGILTSFKHLVASWVASVCIVPFFTPIRSCSFSVWNMQFLCLGNGLKQKKTCGMKPLCF